MNVENTINMKCATTTMNHNPFKDNRKIRMHVIKCQSNEENYFYAMRGINNL